MASANRSICLHARYVKPSARSLDKSHGGRQIIDPAQKQVLRSQFLGSRATASVANGASWVYKNKHNADTSKWYKAWLIIKLYEQKDLGHPNAQLGS
jgi:hypothetical protein